MTFVQKQNEPSVLGMTFSEGQEVSFIFHHEIRTGKILKLLVNSAVIELIKIPHLKDEEPKTIINYRKLMSVY